MSTLVSNNNLSVRHRIPILQRERAAILYLRRKFSYSTQAIAQAFHRSLSLIHQILKWNTHLGTLPRIDLRHLPARVKKIANARMTRQLGFYMEKWLSFLSGESEKPP